MIKIKLNAFDKLQGDMSNPKFAKKIGTSNVNLGRVKSGSGVGPKFIAKFLKEYPSADFEDYFKIEK